MQIELETQCRDGDDHTILTDHIDQVRRLERFISPQVARFILSCDEGDLLRYWRREITVVFGDLRGFTSFAETAGPECLMAVVRMYHKVLGEIIVQFDGTLERFTGDGIMVYFDEGPVEEQAEQAAVGSMIDTELAAGLALHGFRSRVIAYNVRRLRPRMPREA